MESWYCAPGTEVGRIGKTRGHFLDLSMAFQRFFNQFRQFFQTRDDALAGFKAQATQASEVQGQQAENGQLRCERLGRSDSNFGAGVQVNAAVGFLGDTAADDIADRQSVMALAFHLAQRRRQGVRSFTALRDPKDQRIVSTGGLR